MKTFFIQAVLRLGGLAGLWFAKVDPKIQQSF
jgi:hypothetical protein